MLSLLSCDSLELEYSGELLIISGGEKLWEGRYGCSGGGDWLKDRELDGEDAEDFKIV